MDHIPDHMKKILEKGRQGIENYTKLLNAIKGVQTKDSLKDKFRVTERQMNEAISSINLAENKVGKCMDMMGLQQEDNSLGKSKSQPAAEAMFKKK